MDRKARIARGIARRIRLRQRCQNSPKAQATVLEACRHDPVRFCNDWIWTYDPRNLAKGLPEYLPFQLYPRQRELLGWIDGCLQAQEHGAVPKARGTGGTYTALAYSLWLWRFGRAASVKWGSRTEEDVDQIGNPDSIFEKARIAIRKFPDWMLPDGYNPDVHDNHKRIINPETGAQLIGQQGRNMGRGGRSLLYLWDEPSYHDAPKEVERAVKGNTDCLIEISTFNGPNNPFARKVKSGQVRVFEMPWDSIPWRDQDWYEKKEREYAHDPEGFAQNISMDMDQSVDQLIIPSKWVQAATEYAIDADGYSRSAGLDVGESHDLSVYVARQGPVVGRVEDWTNSDPTQTARRAVDYGREDEIDRLLFDSIGIGSGVAGELANFEDDQGGLAEAAIGFEFEGVNVSEPATEQWWPDDRMSKEWLANLKIEIWWRVRERFRKTFENHNRQGAHPDDECVSIPDHPKLVSQLSWPKWERGRGGKYRVEKKQKTKDRIGTGESYDFADAMMLAFADDILSFDIWIG